jgi:hypothetical protein
MTLWHRAPRSVYEVYDEEQYLSGEGNPVGEPGSAGEDLGQTSVPYRGPRTVRLLALALLAVVTVSALGIVAVGLVRHPKVVPALGVARREHTHSSRTSAIFKSTTPVSTVRPGLTAHVRAITRVSAASPAAASAITASTAPRPRGPSRSGLPQQRFATYGRSSKDTPAAPLQSSSSIASETVWVTGESPLTNETRIADEFGFER